jgi:tetratricopeptide (TPR) repeat protein
MIYFRNRCKPTIRPSENNRGLVKVDLQDYDGAWQDYNKALEINPDFGEAHYNLG